MLAINKAVCKLFFRIGIASLKLIRLIFCQQHSRLLLDKEASHIPIWEQRSRIIHVAYDILLERTNARNMEGTNKIRILRDRC